MQSFTFNRARSESEAFAAALQGGRYIAGGTTLIDLMREEVETPHRLVDINALPLRDVIAGNGQLHIGALARMSEVAEHPEVLSHQPLIVQALLEGASPQLRNAASIGGNLLQRTRCAYFRQLDAACNKRQLGAGCAAVHGLQTNHAILGTSDHCIAVHPSDLAVALVALDAKVHVRGPSRSRSFPLDRLYRLPAQSPHLEHNLDVAELIVAVTVPDAARSLRTAYLKVRDRSSYEFALVSVAAAIALDGDVIQDVRLAAGGVGTVPWRLRASEATLIGQRFATPILEHAARASVEGARTLSGTEYKRELLPRTVVRALEMARGTA